jgi:hypothetical protein
MGPVLVITDRRLWKSGIAEAGLPLLVIIVALAF